MYKSSNNNNNNNNKSGIIRHQVPQIIDNYIPNYSTRNNELTCNICGKINKLKDTRENDEKLSNFNDRIEELKSLVDIKDDLYEQSLEYENNYRIEMKNEGKSNNNIVELIELDAKLNKLRKDESYLCSKISKDQIELAKQIVLLNQDKEKLINLRNKKIELSANKNLQDMIITDLSANINSNLKSLENIRYNSIIKLFIMLPIKPDFPTYNGKQYLKPINYNIDNGKKGNKDDVRLIRLNGCSCIMGIPLQNNGNYKSHHTELVSTALANISHLLESIASILNIKLIHPLKVFESYECLVSQNGNQHINIPITPEINHNCDYKTIWSSLNNNPINDDKDNNNNNNNESFPLALSLLRANVIGLCLKIGIDAINLWPSQSILLNMHVLYSYCLDKLNQSNMIISKLSLIPHANDRITPNMINEFHPLYSLVSRYKSVRTTTSYTNNESIINNVEFEVKKDHILDDEYFFINP